MLEASRSLGIIFFPAFDWAISPAHPERQERLLYTQDQLWEEGIFDIPGICEYKPDIATAADIGRVHFCFPDMHQVVTESHLISAGGAIRAARLVMDGTTERAFALVRPPGHHAMKTVLGDRGFCIINIEAVMVEYIRAHYGPKRIAIVDTDCHHGDGTQDIYWHDPDILYISLHQDGRTLYPGSGFPDEMGGPNGRGRTINIPLPPCTGDEGYLCALKQIVLPILEDFHPDLVINSAGQDNHYTDPITNMSLSAQGYARLNDLLNPDIAVLEGGYSIQGALPYVNLGIVLAMAGIDYHGVREPDFDPQALRQSASITAHIAQLAPDIVDRYRNPGRYAKRPPDGQWDSRTYRVYYDTDGIAAQETDRVLVCDACPGIRTIASKSTAVAQAMGIEIPFGACARCRSAAAGIIAQEHASRTAQTVQVIDRPHGTSYYI